MYNLRFYVTSVDNGGRSTRDGTIVGIVFGVMLPLLTSLFSLC